MMRRVFQRSVLTLIVVVVTMGTFLFIYNTYMLDHSLFNLKVSLKHLATVENPREMEEIRQILDVVLVQEIARDSSDFLAAAKLEFSGQIAGRMKQYQQIQDIRFLLGDIVEQREERRNPFFALLDSILMKLFPHVRQDQPQKIRAMISEMEKKIPLYDGIKLQAHLIRLAQMNMRLREWPVALELLQRAASAGPESKEGRIAKLYVGIVYKFTGEYERARKVFSELRSVLEKDLKKYAIYQEAQILYAEGRKGQALQKLEEFFDDSPGEEFHQFSQFRAAYEYLYTIHDHQKAYQSFQKLHEYAPQSKYDEYAVTYLYPRNAEPYVEEGAILLDEGYNLVRLAHEKEARERYQGALNLFHQAVKICPPETNDTVVSIIARNYRETGFKLVEQGYLSQQANQKAEATLFFSDAIEKFDLATQFFDREALAYSGKGLTLLFLGKPQEALDAAREAVRLNPENEETLAHLGYVYYRVGMLDEAIDVYRKSMLVLRDSPLLHYNLGTMLVKKGNLVGAIENFKQAIDADPKYSYAYNNLGYILWVKGAYQEAQTNLERAVSLSPDYVDARYNLGVLFFTIGKYEQAQEQFQVINRLHPGFKKSQQFLRAIEKRAAQ
ncbi:MAG: tetratricopeptide repeat protein [Candidatus Omnitrophica bacterium]|nr:tetratricopeptide repeat protein [Candidatus Omnitrophota bacterium]